jgi:UDP-2,3-diacylglucosamine pyrophosphatase LpxH
VSKHHFKTVFISDLHLATKVSKVEELDKFLASFTCEKLYLVGDIIDGWAISKGNGYFHQSHVNIIRKLLSKAKNGTLVYYVIGNHDEFLRNYTDFISSVGNIRIADQFEFTTVTGLRYLVVHGDKFDNIILLHKWLAHLGDSLYNILVTLNGWLNKIRQKFGFTYWSLAGFLKTKVKSALEFVYSFERTLSVEAKRKGFNGIIAGHIHVASDKIVDDIHYLNCGDGVESCTAIVETFDGELKIINWFDVVKA